jgi:hypothetical protein
MNGSGLQIMASISNRVGLYGFLAGLLVASTLLAQTAPPPANLDPDRRPKKVTVILDSNSKELADEYLDVLQELKDVVDDYGEYLAQTNDEILTQYKKQFDQLSENLDKGVYSSNHDKLSEDLTRNIDQIEELETHIRESDEVYPAKLYRLVRSLRRQLTSVQELLSQDVAQRLAEVGKQLANISVYVSEAMAGLEVRCEQTPDGKTIYYFVGDTNSEVSKIRHRLMVMQHSKGASNPSVEVEIPDVHVEIPNTPMPPMPPMQVDGIGHGYAYSDDEVGLSKQLLANATVASDKAQIEVINKLGSVHLNGTSDNQIHATLDVEVSASSRQMEKDFIQRTELEVTSSPEGYRVAVNIPKSSSRDVRLLKSSLTISVPSKNPIVCTSSFGDVAIAGLSGGLNLSASYSPVDISNVKGGVDVSSSMGELKLTSCTGPIKARNAYAQTTLAACTGEMDLENSYSEISITGSKGDVKVRNSGVVKVSEHSGDVQIDNTYGEVDVSDMTGNLTASNAYSPMTIKSVKGKVSVQNANSKIDLTDIQGELSISNKFGQVFAESLAGPLQLSNVNGNVNVVLDRKLRGNSSISTTFGNINLTVPQNLDLFLKARTVYGDIKSFMPISLIDDGMSHAGTLKLGRGLDSLSLVGSNGSIIINESD